eukprot:SAG11_NODE_13439_length_655_cov_1.017986_1_plen_63_part_10
MLAHPSDSIPLDRAAATRVSLLPMEHTSSVGTDAVLREILGTIARLGYQVQSLGEELRAELSV